jgi:type II secretory pathway pseudopilin PulG
MTGRSAVRRRVNRLGATLDAGVSLLEVVVSMSIMGMVMAVFTTGFLAMYSSANRTEAISIAQSQANLVFQRLDKEIRYATAISEPSDVGPDFYVEYLTTTPTGAATCTQLRLDTTDPTNAKLRLRTWPQGSQPPAWGTSAVLASNLGSAQPFYTADNPNFQRLSLKLQVAAGSGGTASKARTEITFTALNSESAAAAGYKTVCTEGRPAS